jgi:Sulfotransferase family
MKSAAHLPASVRQFAPAYRADPVFVLAAPRSFSSVVAAMVGQHPQMFGLPELQLFGAETISEWWELCARATFPMAHGLLRAVAELIFGEQTEKTVQRARGWLQRRSHFSTSLVFELLAERAQPLTIAEKSPSIVYRQQFLERALRSFPRARFIHLVRHPWGHAQSILKAIDEARKQGEVPQWVMNLAAFPNASHGGESPREGPQRSWYVLNHHICTFLDRLPAAQKMRVRGETLLNAPDEDLREIAQWLGLRTDPAAIEEMKHPERSPFACWGPPGARLGNDYYFLTNPALRPDRAEVHRLDEPLVWHLRRFALSADVEMLAREFGYD